MSSLIVLMPLMALVIVNGQDTGVCFDNFCRNALQVPPELVEWTAVLENAENASNHQLNKSLQQLNERFEFLLEWNNTLTDRANTRLKSLVAQVNAQQLEKLLNRIEKCWQEVESPIREKRANQKQLIEEARARVVEGSIRMSEWLEMKFDETQTESLSRDIKQEWTQWVRETKKALLESNEPEFLQEFQRELDQHLNQMLNSHVQQALQDERIAAENVYKASADQVISKLAHVNQATSECMDKVSMNCFA